MCPSPPVRPKTGGWGLLASQRRGRTSVTNFPHNTDGALVAVGFTAGDDGILEVPSGSRVKLVPIDAFYQLKIILPGSAAVTAVLSERALVVKL